MNQRERKEVLVGYLFGEGRRIEQKARSILKAQRYVDEIEHIIGNLVTDLKYSRKNWSSNIGHALPNTWISSFYQPNVTLGEIAPTRLILPGLYGLVHSARHGGSYFQKVGHALLRDNMLANNKQLSATSES